VISGWRQAFDVRPTACNLVLTRYSRDRVGLLQSGGRRWSLRNDIKQQLMSSALRRAISS